MLLDYLKRVKDTRGRKGQIYDQAHILFFSILAMLNGATSYRKIHIFIESNFKLLKENFDIPRWKKSPAYTTIRGIIQGVDKDSFEEHFRAYSLDLSDQKNKKMKLAAGDGKTLKRSYNHMEDEKAKHIFSIFDTEENLILAHEIVDEKTNEIPVFQDLVGKLGLTGYIFTLDALHCQKKL